MKSSFIIVSVLKNKKNPLNYRARARAGRPAEPAKDSARAGKGGQWAGECRQRAGEGQQDCRSRGPARASRCIFIGF